MSSHSGLICSIEKMPDVLKRCVAKLVQRVYFHLT